MKTSVLSLWAYARTALFAAILSVAASAVHAQNSIENVNVSPQAGGKVIIRVGLKEPLATAPAGFTVNNPPRLAFDFANTGNALGRNVQNVGDGDVRRINIVQAGDRTRMVMELTRSLKPTKPNSKVERSPSPCMVAPRPRRPPRALPPDDSPRARRQPGATAYATSIFAAATRVKAAS